MLTYLGRLMPSSRKTFPRMCLAPAVIGTSQVIFCCAACAAIGAIGFIGVKTRALRFLSM